MYQNNSLIETIREINPELAMIAHKHGENVLSDDYFVQALLGFRSLQSDEKIALMQTLIDRLQIEAQVDIEYIRNETIRTIRNKELDTEYSIVKSNNQTEIEIQEIHKEIVKMGYEKDIKIQEIEALKEVEIEKIKAEIAEYGFLTETAITLIKYRQSDWGEVKLDNSKSIKWVSGRNK